MSSSIAGTTSIESGMHATRAGRASGATRAVALPYIEQSVPVGLVGAASVAAFAFVLDAIAGHPLATPNILGAALLRGEIASLAAPIQPGLVFGYTLLHVATFIVVASAAVSAEFTLTRAGVRPEIQLLAGVSGLMLSLTLILGVLMTLVGLEWAGSLGFERMICLNSIAALSMAITVHLRGEAHRLARQASTRD